MLYDNFLDYEGYEFYPENGDVLTELTDLVKRDEMETSAAAESPAPDRHRWNCLFRCRTATQNEAIINSGEFFSQPPENDRIIGDYQVDYCPTQMVRVSDLFGEMKVEESSDEESSSSDAEAGLSLIACAEILQQIVKAKENVPIEPQIIDKFVSMSCKQINDCVTDDVTLLSEENLTDGIVIRLCEDLTACDHQLSLSWSVAFVDVFVLRKVRARQMAPSRAFMTAISKFSEKYPRALVEGLMIPCITDLNCSRIQMDVVKHIFVQSTSHQHQDMFLKKFLEQCFVWTEAVVAFLSVCVEMRSDVIYEDVLDSLITRISDCTQNLDSNLTFSKFLIVILTKLRVRLRPTHVVLLTAVVNKNKTFLKKSCLSKLQSINE